MKKKNPEVLKPTKVRLSPTVPDKRRIKHPAKKGRHYTSYFFFHFRTWRFIFNEPPAASGRASGDKWRRLRQEGDFVLEVSDAMQ